MTLEQIIRGLQSRIAKRQNEITGLECQRSEYKALGIHLLKNACAAEIKPLAIAQKLDKVILDIMCAQRTLNSFVGSVNGGIYIEMEEGAMRI